MTKRTYNVKTEDTIVIVQADECNISTSGVLLLSDYVDKTLASSMRITRAFNTGEWMEVWSVD